MSTCIQIIEGMVPGINRLAAWSLWSWIVVMLMDVLMQSNNVLRTPSLFDVVKYFGLQDVAGTNMPGPVL